MCRDDYLRGFKDGLKSASEQYNMMKTGYIKGYEDGNLTRKNMAVVALSMPNKPVKKEKTWNS